MIQVLSDAATMNQDLLSSDEDYAPRISVPSVNLAQFRKKDRAKPNFSKARKKFTTNKVVRFPDQPNVRDSFVSNLSNILSSDDEQPAGLPSFAFDPNAGGYRSESPFSDDSRASYTNTDQHGPFEGSALYHTDSSDGEHRAEIDITDIRRVDLSAQLHRSLELRGRLVFRRMLAAEHVDAAGPRSDTFLARVLNFGAAGAGLSGGGLAPGAARSGDAKDDPERAAGGLADDHAVEMRNLNFAELNDEARTLIHMHAPELEHAEHMRAGSQRLGSQRRGSQNRKRKVQRGEGGGARESGSAQHEGRAGDEDEEYGGDGDGDYSEDDAGKNREENGGNGDGNGGDGRDNLGHGRGSLSLGESAAHLIEKEKTDSTNATQTDVTQTESRNTERTDTSSSFYQPNPDLLRADLEEDLRDDDFWREDGYVAPPQHVHAGVLSSLLKLYQHPHNAKSSATFASSTTGTTGTTGITGTTLADDYNYSDSSEYWSNTRDKKLSKRKKGKEWLGRLRSKPAVPEATESDHELADGVLDGEAAQLPSFQNARPKQPRGDKAMPRLGKKLKKRQDQKLRITVHIADILQRQRFIIRMCRALMMYGAPTHRLEEYMVMTSRVLEIDGQFVYFPGTMLVAFGDAATRTSEVHLVRCAQGLHLSKLSDTHKIYKDVIHDLEGVEGASQKLEQLMARPNAFSPWMCVFLYGLGSASVCTWGFGGGWLDIPVAFGVGLFVGYLQFYVSSKLNLYLSVFEVTASIVVSFVARGIGSINSGELFCFGAIAQGSLALILPGYIILCGSLELQLKNLVAGSVRMFYAIIYSLFLGFGITLGAALYGWVDSNATDAAQCLSDHSIDDKWRILFVPLFSLCLGLINQARWRQTPIMIVILSVAYVGTYFAGKHFANVTEFTASIGAFIIGILGNMYSRVGKGMAVAAMLPAIFVQVPSGIASKSTLLAGVNTANKITNSSSSSTDTTDISSLAFGATMVEVSIGISVGLFAAALVVYPFGKRRTSLFTL